MRLIHKTFRVYLLPLVSIFLLSIPAVYFLVQYLWIQDVDESLGFQKQKIISNITIHKLDAAQVLQLFSDIETLDFGLTLQPLAGNPPIKDSLHYLDQYDSVRAHVEPFRVLSSTVYLDNQPYQLTIRKDLVEHFDLIEGIVLTMIGLFFILIVAIFLINRFVTIGIWKPFYHTLALLREFQIDKAKPVHFQPTHILEFDQLNDAIKQLSIKNIEVFKAQKEFTENAAHEINTPLAAIKNQIDLLSQEVCLSESQHELLSRIDRNIRILTKLNRNLLLLSKIDNAQFDLTQNVSIKSIVESIIELFEEQVRLKNIQLTSELNHDFNIKANEYLIHSLFTNLIANAIKYTPDRGSIMVMLSPQFFTIKNTGITTELDTSVIFNRFYRAGNLPGSAGLGLAIVQNICSTLQYRILYEFIPPSTHAFSVYFNAGA